MVIQENKVELFSVREETDFSSKAWLIDIFYAKAKSQNVSVRFSFLIPHYNYLFDLTMPLELVKWAANYYRHFR